MDASGGGVEVPSSMMDEMLNVVTVVTYAAERQSWTSAATAVTSSGATTSFGAGDEVLVGGGYAWWNDNVTEYAPTTAVAAIPVAILNATTPVADSVFESKLIIPLYVVIFLLAVVGNALVLVTLAQNKRMRTVTNVYLLNLAVSDLLLGVFCMPFTLVGQVLRNFIFGAAMCKLIPYFQVVSVSVGVWTLVAISLERYFAICRPLKSRRWQTQFHAYKMIAVVWVSSLLWSIPVLVVSSLKAMRGKGFKCREFWPTRSSEQAYSIFLDAILLLIPLIILCLAYSLIMSKLWKGLRREIQHNSTCVRQSTQTDLNVDRTYISATPNGVLGTNNNSTATDNGSAAAIVTPLRHPRRMLPPPPTGKSEKTGKAGTVKMWIMRGMVRVKIPSLGSARGASYLRENNHVSKSALGPRCDAGDAAAQSESVVPAETEEGADETTYTFSRHAIRSNYMDKSIEAKRKVIRMLFVIVAEFFVCWAPIHVLNTWYLFYPDAVYQYVGSTGVALVQLLAYISSCCNPITYCFMNRKFRQAFLGVFGCYNSMLCCSSDSASHNARLGGLQRAYVQRGTIHGNSDVSGNDSTIYMGRASTIGRSEVVVLEAEDRV